MKIVKLVLFALLLSAMLGACGNKGPLYLPQDETDVTTATGSNPQSPESDEKEDKNQDERPDA